MEENTTKTNVYEIGFLLVPTIAEGSLASEFGVLKSKIEEIGGVSIAEEFPQLIDLAYEMAKTISNKKTKFNQGYFGWIKFELSPDKIVSVKNYAETSDMIIRALIITTVRENTVVGKKFAPRTDRKRAPARTVEVSSDKPAEPINEVELDKQIEGLVTE